ncbi:winged helix-turn-helix domain-containing tetratricopeptide repeat protein [Ovoidimarina sediminis]|uniref:winged helix-turn-helix domain-containing tetratricopeptide repeat protein n=1 Tax=Ovoidimarina sediminis TaxID=3079856 RepID=UPI002907DF11|nr:winged helix-turn-helix domain-containing tetratricopeptide repeat protein [Rhodophyticola sp. MJ-SS7]MDU8945590.1 winged helix-turn-helix domain-containing tetratricopeptide repeat protein [Rhodophyticola sp. MJ-SS7]
MRFRHDFLETLAEHVTTAFSTPMAGHDVQVYRFEGFTLDIAGAELRANGAPVPMEPQVFDLLTLLVRNHDRVVTKDEIIETVWSGRIVSESAVSSRVNALRRALGDDGTEQRLVKTVHGRGFRFGATPETDSPAPAGTAATTPSIAVLPFAVMGDSPDLAFFADGIAEDILNALSRFHELSVIARNSSFAFRGQAVSAREIAATLGVKYILEGSVRQVGHRIRVAVQLIDAGADRTIWSDRYDGELTDIFEVQDEITAKAVTAIAPQTQYHEMSSAFRKDIARLSDWERVMRARWHMDKFSRDDTDTALAILEQVIETAPDLALAHSTKAFCHYHKMLNAWCADPIEEIRAAEAAARRAATLDAYDAGAIAVLGLAAMFGGRHDECFDRLEAALAINPNLASAYGFKATAHGCKGEYDATLAAFDRAMALSPADPTRTLWMSGKGIALILARKFEAAIDNTDRMLQVDPDYGPALRQRVSALAHLGRMDEARVALDQLLARMPHLTIERLEKMIPIVPDANQQLWLEGLRMAGLPER